MKKIFNLFLLAASLMGCESQLEKIQNSLDDQTLTYLEKQGFPKNGVKLMGDRVIVDEDGIMSLKEIKIAMGQSSSSINSRVSQWRANFIASNIRAGYITVYVNPNLSAKWKTAISAAILEWKNINKNFSSGTSNVYFIQSSSPNADIVISPYSGGVNSIEEIAMSEFPDNYGYVGGSIKISSDLAVTGNLSDDQRKGVIMHELGHTIGLRHTNIFYTGEILDALPVAGSPPFYTDSESIMNGPEPGSQLVIHSKFSSLDKIAIGFLWP